MKRKGLLVFVLVLVSVVLVSCGKDKELTSRVDALEMKMKELEDVGLPESYYGSIYKLDDRSWTALEQFYNENEKCKNQSWDDPYYFVWRRYEDGKDAYLKYYGVTIGFKDKETLTMSSDSVALDMSYSMMGNDIMIDTYFFAKLSGYSDSDAEAYKGVKMCIGSLSDDRMTLTLSTEIQDYAILYLQ